MVNTPRELAYRLALAARWLCDTIKLVFKDEKQTGPLHGQVQAFRDTLLPNLSNDDFADMYAQTIVYGLFAARVAEPDQPNFSVNDASRSIPKTNPFLRLLFQEIADYELDDAGAPLVASDLAYTPWRASPRRILRTKRQLRKS
jgi:hypothetical protein